MTSIDIKYRIWKFGVVFTDGVSEGVLDYSASFYSGHIFNIMRVFL